MAAGTVGTLAVSPDGATLATSHREIRLWDTATGRRVRTLVGHSDGVNSIAFSPDGELLASVCDDRTLRPWDVAPGVEIWAIQTSGGLPKAVAFGPDGRSITCSAGKDILIYDLHAYDPRVDLWLTGPVVPD